MTNDELARAILAANAYAVLATADADGTPWATPVFFAHENARELYWVSDPGARHSRNLAARPAVAAVVYDSTVVPGEGQAVYLTAAAAEVTDPAAIEAGLRVFALAAEAKGAWRMASRDVTGDARLRLYRAAVCEHWILDPDSPHDRRTAVRP